MIAPNASSSSSFDQCDTTLMSDRKPLAKYNKLSEKLRQMTPDDLQCSVFCGGRKCKYESPTSWEDKDMAIKGLYSHWITDDILATARPNTAIIEKYDIIDQFKRANIKSLINLQSRGEHSSCGPLLDDSGFSYNPQVFMKNGIFFYNFSIKDYGVASRDFLLDMVKVMAFALSEGRVIVHCHAGLGRTGVLIACYLVYALRVRANEAITYVRMKRPKSIQTRGQLLCVRDFTKYILPNFIVFPLNSNKSFEDTVDMSLEQCLQQQDKVLHGYEARDLKFIPKLVFIICQRLLHLCQCVERHSVTDAIDSQKDNDDDNNTASGGAPFWKAYLSFTFFDDNHLATKVQSLSDVTPPKPILHKLERKTSASTLAEWSLCSSPATGSLDSSSSFSRSSSTTCLRSMPSQNTLDGSSTTSNWEEEGEEETEEERNIALVANLAELEDSLSLFSVGSTIDDSILSPGDVTQNACYQELASQADLRKSTPLGTPRAVAASDVVQNFLRCTHPKELDNRDLQEKVKQYQQDLNDHSMAWEMLARENDPLLLTAILVTWFQSFKKPIYGEKELSIIAEIKGNNTIAILSRLPSGVKFTTEYLLRFVCQLCPLLDDQRLSLLGVVTLLLQTGHNQNSQLGAEERKRSHQCLEMFTKKLMELLCSYDSPKNAESPIGR